ncbi:hypothetical protein ACSMXM_14125 [Pacificimonas sp. ICDLI1SI03]
MTRTLAFRPLTATAFSALAAAALGLFVAAPAQAQLAKPQSGTVGSFTPSGGNSRLSEAESRFSFTPADKKAAKRRGVSVGVTSRVVADSEGPASAEVATARIRTPRTPAEVEAKLDVGYRGFSLSGGVVKATDRTLGTERAGTEVGIAYGGKRWRAAVEAGASVSSDSSRILPDRIGDAEHVELGGAYALSSRLSVKGGVRYDRLHPEAYGRDFVNRDADKAEESGTVYLGTSFSF